MACNIDPIHQHGSDHGESVSIVSVGWFLFVFTCYLVLGKQLFQKSPPRQMKHPTSYRELLLHSGYQTLLNERNHYLPKYFLIDTNVCHPSRLYHLIEREKRKTIYRATTVLTARKSPSDIKFLIFPVIVKELTGISNKKTVLRRVYVETDKCGKTKKTEEWIERKRHKF